KPEQPGQAVTIQCGKDWRTFEAEWRGSDLSVTSGAPRVFGSKNYRSVAGHIALESPKGVRAEFRNVRLQPLNLTRLFNGQDLSGWKAVSQPPPKKAGGPLGPITGALKSKPKDAAWSVSSGSIHVENGRGRLESTETYDDFVMQLTARTGRGQPKA